MKADPITVTKVAAKRPFHVLVKPVGPVCNLACDYCFYLDKTGLYPGNTCFEMRDEVLVAHIRNYIESQPVHCKEVTFGWQGGEPTLRGVHFFRRVVALQQKYVRPGMKIVNTLQTNGVLLNDEWGIFLKQHHFLVGISIDGDEALHDHYRKTNSGKGSYQKVIRGLKCLQKHGVDVNVLTVIQQHNGDHARRVYQHLVGLGVQFIQFIPVVEPEPGKGVSCRSVSPEQFGRFMCEVFDCWRENDIGRVFISHFDNALGMSLGMPSSSCVHASVCGENLVAEHNGDVYSCDHLVFPSFRLGNLAQADYPDLIVTPVQQQFAASKPEAARLHCLNCPVRGLCNGACPAQRVDEHGEVSFTSGHYLCKGYYQFFSHISPYLSAMGQCLRRGLPPANYQRFLSL
ncbi:anaerobic sulfatase maturase [Vibrio albus]|uniref:Anaerobic sulfatase maturase n=1 Tax=Vibrio albus TaxID=2200953 RepID=A0A2U3B724_9VIBR|nr:anaerobic sulfatase maturase [Vibrio albus]PWI32524.1 anaerobic sulfatase maturase [Vibrio albus]